MCSTSASRSESSSEPAEAACVPWSGDECLRRPGAAQAAAILLSAVLFLTTAGSSPLEAADANEVLALFQRRCVECHGAAKQNGGLRLDSVDAVFKGGKSGPAISAGKAAESTLFNRLTAEGKKRMPPRGDPLPRADLELVQGWIDGGARSAPSRPGKVSVPRDPKKLSLPGAYAPVHALCGDPTGPRLAVGVGARVAIVEVSREENSDAAKKGAGWSSRSLALLDGQRDVVESLAFSPDGKLLAVGDFARVHVWSAGDWKRTRVLEPLEDRVLALAFSPDGARLAAGAGAPTERGEVKLWNAGTGSLEWAVTPHSDCVFGLGWTPAGLLLTASADRSTLALDGGTGKILHRLEAHTHHVLGVAVSADGKRAVTCGADRKLKLWDLEKWELSSSLKGHEKQAAWVGFLPGGERFISAGGDGKLRLWDVDKEDQRLSLGEARESLQAGTLLDGGKVAAASDVQGKVRLFLLEDKKPILELTAEDLLGAGPSKPRDD